MARIAEADGVQWRGRSLPERFCRRFQPAAPQHLVRGASCEREQENALGPNAVIDEVGDPVHQRASLATSCAGHYQQRAVAVRGRCKLIRVQLSGEVARGGIRRNDSRPQWYDCAAVLHHTRNIPEGGVRFGANHVVF
jgi:hypothetical protein